MDERTLHPSPLIRANDPRLAQVVRHGRDSLLLKDAATCHRLAEALQTPRQLIIEMQPQSLSVFDFGSAQADIFFTEAVAAEMSRRYSAPAMLGLFLPCFSAWLLHASAIVRSQRAAVFLARDEGGKTTAVRLAASGTILSDDRVLVRQGEDGFRAFGTPWGLYANNPNGVRIGGFFLLEKASHFSLEPLDSSHLLHHLQSEPGNPLAILPAMVKQQAAEIIAAVSRAAPVWRLAFPREHLDWKVLDKTLSG